MKAATKDELRRALKDFRDRIMGGWEATAVCEECGAPLFDDDQWRATAADFEGCWGAALGWGSPHVNPDQCYRYRMVERRHTT